MRKTTPLGENFTFKLYTVCCDTCGKELGKPEIKYKKWYSGKKTFVYKCDTCNKSIEESFHSPGLTVLYTKEGATVELDSGIHPY